MKRFINIWSLSYLLVSVFFILISYNILKNLNIDTSFIRLSIGGLVISLCLALSVSIFRAKSLNALLRVIGGFFFIMPITFIARNLFGVIIFRYSFVVYGAAFLSALIYAFMVLMVKSKVKAQEKELNQLLAKNKDNR